MNYYLLTFSDNKTYPIQSENNLREFIKEIRNFVSIFYFDDVIYLERPFKIEKLQSSPEEFFVKWKNE